MGRGYVGANAEAEVITQYEYAGSTFYNEYEFLDYLSYNIKMATDTKTYLHYMPQIADMAVEVARDFILSNGTYRTGELYRSVKWRPVDNGIELYADARDGAGRAYAGHIEYGFVDRGGMPQGPWPFLRPAMRIAAEASTGDLANIAATNILYGIGSDSGFLSFGRANLSRVIANAGGMAHVQNQVHRGFGSSNRHGTIAGGRGNSRRWTDAKHGIDHMKGLKNDNSKEGKALYSSFRNKFGETMDRDEFRWSEI